MYLPFAFTAILMYRANMDVAVMLNTVERCDWTACGYTAMPTCVGMWIGMWIGIWIDMGRHASRRDDDRIHLAHLLDELANALDAH